MVYIWYFPVTVQEILCAVYGYVVSHNTMLRLLGMGFFVMYAIYCSQSRLNYS